MTLEEAIKHCEDVAEDRCGCGEDCVEEHRQLAKWLKELKERRKTAMSIDDAYYLVYKDMTSEEGMLTGRYDAKNGNEHFMYGILTVMEFIAYKVGYDCLNAFSDRFADNMARSQEKGGSR